MTTPETIITSNPVLDALNQHVSVRNYRQEPIADDLLRTILNAARRSPTSSNIQAYSFVVVRNPETKQQLAVLAGNQSHIETCDVFIAVCADITRLEKATELYGKSLAKNLENSMVATVDASLAGMSLSLAAESVGIGTVMIGGMRNRPQEVAEVLGLPSGVFVVYGICLGYPDEDKFPEQKPRLPEDLIIHYEQYTNSDPTPQLQAHDAELAAHYRNQGRRTPDGAWTNVIADKFSVFQRPKLKATLESMGFRFD